MKEEKVECLIDGLNKCFIGNGTCYEIKVWHVRGTKIGDLYIKRRCDTHYGVSSCWENLPRIMLPGGHNIYEKWLYFKMTNLAHIKQDKTKTKKWFRSAEYLNLESTLM
jgi:hypothetical protein